jgi:putative transposase
VRVQCRVLRVSRSGYYRWLESPQSHRVVEDRRLSELIAAQFERSKRTYGSPRVTHVLRALGERCGRRRVARLMRGLRLAARQRRAYRATTNSRHALPVASNVLGRQFKPCELDAAWCSDITYLATNEGWLYLACVMDLASRRIVGWSMSERIDEALVTKALHSALLIRKPKAGLVLHSDRGAQYASEGYRKILKRCGIVQSMSRRGNCWDNAPMESFFHSLKSEWLAGRSLRTRTHTRSKVFEYIEVWYNRQRLHSALGYQSPVSYELNRTK